MFLGQFKKILIAKTFAVVLLFPVLAHAASSQAFSKGGFLITVEPIVGYEFAKANTPSVHTRGMLVYGARVTAGHPLISGEGEFTMGTVNETFPLSGQNTKTDKKNVRLGLRSMIALNAWSSFIFRGGGQATQTKVAVTTISTASTVTANAPWDIRPYAGTGVNLFFSDMVNINLEVTYVFRSTQDWSQNEVQPTFSFKFNLPH